MIKFFPESHVIIATIDNMYVHEVRLTKERKSGIVSASVKIIFIRFRGPIVGTTTYSLCRRGAHKGE